MLFPTTTLLALAATMLFGTAVEAQNPRSVTVRSYAGSRTCRGGSSAKTVRVGSGCQSFASNGALSYEVNRDDDDCIMISYRDGNCRNRVATRELDRDDDNDGDDDDCEHLPRKAQSFKVRCFRDDDRFD